MFKTIKYPSTLIYGGICTTIFSTLRQTQCYLTYLTKVSLFRVMMKNAMTSILRGK